MARWENELYGQGGSIYKGGGALVDEGLGGLRDLDRTFSDQINQGGLSAGVRRGFDLARGRLTDAFTRSGRSLQATLAQRRLQSGGALTPGAVAELTAEADKTRSEGLFDATNQLEVEQANLEQKTTLDLFDRVAKIRDTIRETGLSREQLGVMAQLQAAALKLQGKRDRKNFLTSLFDMGSKIVGGFGGG